jgi:hypothetical protein
MPDLLPVHQVGTMENRHSGIIGKRRINQIIIVLYPANAGVGIKTREYRIFYLSLNNQTKQVKH